MLVTALAGLAVAVAPDALADSAPSGTLGDLAALTTAVTGTAQSTLTSSVPAVAAVTAPVVQPVTTAASAAPAVVAAVRTTARPLPAKVESVRKTVAAPASRASASRLNGNIQPVAAQLVRPVRQIVEQLAAQVAPAVASVRTTAQAGLESLGRVDSSGVVPVLLGPPRASGVATGLVTAIPVVEQVPSSTRLIGLPQLHVVDLAGLEHRNARGVSPATRDLSAAAPQEALLGLGGVPAAPVRPTSAAAGSGSAPSAAAALADLFRLPRIDLLHRLAAHQHAPRSQHLLLSLERPD